MIKKISAFVLFASAALFTAAPAQAYFQVCNQSSVAEIDVAYAHQTGNDEWLSEGWWKINRGDCVTVVEGPLRHPIYYVYGRSGDTVWQADSSQQGGAFCIRDEKFTLPGDMDCERAGYERRKFIEIDTQDSENFTHYLRD